MRNMKYAYEMSHVMQDVIVTANMQSSQEDKMTRIFAWAACLSVYVVIRMCTLLLRLTLVSKVECQVRKV